MESTFEKLRDVYFDSMSYEIRLSEEFDNILTEIEDQQIHKILQSLNTLSKARMSVIISLLNALGTKAGVQPDDLILPLIERYKRETDK